MCHQATACRCRSPLDAEHEHHAALLREGVGAVEDLLLRVAEAAGDGVGGRDAGDAKRGVLDHLSILDVEMADLFRCPRGGIVIGGELCDHGELPGSVDGYVGPVVASHAVGVVATAVFITNTVVMCGSTTAEWPGAFVWVGDVA